MSPWRSMASPRNYENAVGLLNKMQSNASILEALKSSGNAMNLQSLPEMREWLLRLDMKLEDLDRMAVIHITGTKGKGSTSAFCEKVLRSQGYKTGLFTSPHLLEVRERIRINGEPISKEMFTDYFYQIYDRLQQTRPQDDALAPFPTYFRFLTLMALRLFQAEKVQAPILEVGIGGSYDATNVVNRPAVCGIVSIGIDHEAVLGGSLLSIAKHKAGIMKVGVPAFTCSQVPEAMQVLKDEALVLQAPLYQAPSLEAYEGLPPGFRLGLAGEHQLTNSGLALALCKTWVGLQRGELGPEHPGEKGFQGECPWLSRRVVAEEAEALRSTRWPGRCQTVPLGDGRCTLYLDGAHTLESISACVSWFQQSAREGATKVLLFNCSFDRNPGRLLEPLMRPQLHFSRAWFCPNQALPPGEQEGIPRVDTQNNMAPSNEGLKLQHELRRVWEEGSPPEGSCGVAPSFREAFERATQGLGDGRVDVLVTGSLHLIGAAFTALNLQQHALM